LLGRVVAGQSGGRRGFGDGGGEWVAQGQVGGDLEGAFAAAADQSGGGVQESVAQCFRFYVGEFAVQGEQLQPRDQVAGDGRGGAPAWLMAKSREGRRPRPCPCRSGSGLRPGPGLRWRASRNAICPVGVLVAECSARPWSTDSAPRCGFSRHITACLARWRVCAAGAVAQQPVSSATLALSKVAGLTAGRARPATLFRHLADRVS